MKAPPPPPHTHTHTHTQWSFLAWKRVYGVLRLFLESKSASWKSVKSKLRKFVHDNALVYSREQLEGLCWSLMCVYLLQLWWERCQWQCTDAKKLSWGSHPYKRQLVFRSAGVGYRVGALRCALSSGLAEALDWMYRVSQMRTKDKWVPCVSNRARKLKGP